MGDNTQGINYKLMEGVLDNQNAYAQTTDPKQTNTASSKNTQVSFDTFRPYKFKDGTEPDSEIISNENASQLLQRMKPDADGNSEVVKFEEGKGQTVSTNQKYAVERYKVINGLNKRVFQILSGLDLIQLRLAERTKDSPTGLMAPEVQ
jgi:hypothetical protein